MALSLASIARTTSARPPLVLVHGGPGAGKTTFGAHAPGAIFLRTEDGLGNLSVDAFPVAESYADVIEGIGSLYQEEHDYKWLVIDSLSALESMIWARVAADENKPNIESLGYGKGYVMALSYWHELMQGLKALNADKQMGICLIAHSDTVRHESPEMDGYDRVQIKLHKRAFQFFYEQCDVIGYAAPRVILRSEEKAGGQTRKRGVGTGERLLHVVEQPSFIAKNRYGLASPLPLDWATFEAALNDARAITRNAA